MVEQGWISVLFESEAFRAFNCPLEKIDDACFTGCDHLQFGAGWTHQAGCTCQWDFPCPGGLVVIWLQIEA